MIEYCETCGFLLPKQSACLYYQTLVKPDRDYCSHHNPNPERCEYCNNVIIDKSVIVPSSNSLHFLCEKCALAINTCQFCKNSNKCDFETNPSPIPKVIQKKIQQGPMIQVMQVKNPERIKITCEAGCPCYIYELCAKEYGNCERIESIYE